MNKLNFLPKLTITSIVGGIALINSSFVLATTPFNADDPIGPQPTTIEPEGPSVHPGKEFTDELDRDESGLNDAGRTIAWDGKGGIKDSTDFIESMADTGDIDALAFSQDTLFDAVVNNKTAILFSTRSNATHGEGLDRGAPPNCAFGVPICYETVGGDINVWAMDSEIDNMNTVKNLDALEVWGPKDEDDADKYSLFGEPVRNENAISIFNLDGTAYLERQLVANAVINLFPNNFFQGLDPNKIDIDALMVNDSGKGDKDRIKFRIDDGDEILFSLWPVENVVGANSIIGDEVFYWNKKDGINFLNHGGHEWHSNWLGRNVDALEAAASTPEPGTILGLLAISGLGLGLKRKKQS